MEKLRYVIDQKLLPGQRREKESSFGESSGRGKPRTFTGFEAFGIACAAIMIDAGLRRRIVIDCLDVLCSYQQKGSYHIRDVPLYHAFEKRDVAVMEIGDRLNVRMYGSENYKKKKMDFGWRQVETGAQLTGYDPLVVVGINVAKLRDCFD